VAKSKAKPFTTEIFITPNIDAQAMKDSVNKRKTVAKFHYHLFTEPCMDKEHEIYPQEKKSASDM
jgi:hypothetical protein